MEPFDLYSTPIDEWFKKPIAIHRYKSICLWTDLLGFSKQIKENNWNPSDNKWNMIAGRLRRAHQTFVEQTQAGLGKALILNDGLGYVFDTDDQDLSTLSYYLMLCVRAHCAINAAEKENGYPGGRSILAYGEGIQYFLPEIHLDDFVFRYTREKPMEMSRLARMTGNPTIVYNPAAFQMNTAFSKAFLLDELGSNYKITGNGFFIDQSVFELVREKAISKEQIEQEDSENEVRFRVYPTQRNCYPGRVLFGFRMSKAIPVESEKYNTSVYRIDGFSPVDEPLPFEIKLD